MKKHSCESERTKGLRKFKRHEVNEAYLCSCGAVYVYKRGLFGIRPYRLSRKKFNKRKPSIK